MTIAEGLVDWAYALRLDDIPEKVRAAVGRHMMDGLGTAIAAGRLGLARPAVTVALNLGGPAEAGVLGTGRQVSAPAAALANGTLVHALDFDDTHAGGLVHATSVVLPALFAVAEQFGSSGADALVAAVAGYETVCRISAAAPHAFHARGLHATAVCGVFCAALVAARLMGCTRQQAVDALGIAGSQAAGLLEFLHTGSSTKQMHPGFASQAGILAARLAAAGASGPASVIEGEHGLFAALAGRTVSQGTVLDRLGESWETVAITIKPYPACQLAHAGLDAARAALDQLGLERVAGDAVADVVVDLHPDSAAIVAEPRDEKVRPRTPYDAKFSAQWSIAALLCDGAVTVATYTPESIARPEVAALAERVRVSVVETPGVAADAHGRVAIRLVDGREAEATVACSSGGPRRPLDDAAILAKFTANAGGPGPDVTELARRVRNLAGETDLRGLVALADRLATPSALATPNAA